MVLLPELSSRNFRHLELLSHHTSTKPTGLQGISCFISGITSRQRLRLRDRNICLFDYFIIPSRFPDCTRA